MQNGAVRVSCPVCFLWTVWQFCPLWELPRIKLFIYLWERQFLDFRVFSFDALDCIVVGNQTAYKSIYVRCRRYLKSPLHAGLIRAGFVCCQDSETFYPVIYVAGGRFSLPLSPGVAGGCTAKQFLRFLPRYRIEPKLFGSFGYFFLFFAIFIPLFFM